MDEQELDAALSLLLEEMEGDLGDAHEIYLRLRQILDGMRATGMPVPEDLALLERDLGAEFAEEAEG
jgi:hypothetical protein